MKKSILNLEGVTVLNKTELKKIEGSGRRNCTLTGNEQIIYSGGEAVGYSCEWTCTRTFLGIGIGEVTGWGGCSVWG
ncbi:hypothetical protein M0M57_00040 [Flavobacterium azooxidireducens]|uniref:Bacteriocin n=1 Tax=Flavobacterium azooxidireducens TaxID=1871076 RepID=A0ABY4KEL5_9FLAO|nr:hypothetical protein [Flavobacterium azooxidireducens]UPQ79247.1 hypothetical protein M0M57_00040 [Flavobacterium azooxidireducens]